MNLDMSDVILDPTVAGTAFKVRRRREVVNTFGESTQPGDVVLPAVGSITPLGSNALTREDAYASQADAIRVITQFQLRGAGRDVRNNTFQPDVVLYKGSEYTVMVVNDYPGASGFVEAECVTPEFVRGFPTPQ